MDTKPKAANSMAQDAADNPAEAELAEGRKNSTMTREEALRALDRATRLCEQQIARLGRLDTELDFWQNEVREYNFDLYTQILKQQRENAHGDAHSSKEGGTE